MLGTGEQTMNKEKQIEEMAIEISKTNCKPKGCGFCYLEYGTLENSCEEYLVYKKMAQAVYNAGYRKSIVVAREMCGMLREDLRGFVDGDYLERLLAIYEKKYIGEDNNVPTKTEGGE